LGTERRLGAKGLKELLLLSIFRHWTILVGRGKWFIRAIRHSRMVCRIALAALLLIADRKPIKYFPQRFFARRG
jgi:hypothetical protein